MRFSLCLQLGAALLLFALWRPWRPARATCVLASDFGFNLSCAFKKSGLFRVRNLGGVKGYVGLGFTVGDELGFAQSLSITDANKRRSVAGRSASVKPAVVPPFKPIAPARNSSRPSRLAAAAPATATVPPFQALPASISKVTAFRNALDAATKHFQVRTDVASENSLVSAANGGGESGAARQTVMNAPKEYYPLGYDKNFDDNFASRVQLPQTAFRCGDQKHFPGLYADEDLGCMVFHVCAFTDEGLIMKSFLCPESTLFDQSILKCNWWFYVDCKASARLYDSNIPVSKSYQLMKALAFFSSYNKS